MLNINFANEKPVADFIEYIRERMKVANTAWIDIANALSEAREMFGSDSDKFKSILKQTKISKSTANKFIAIATSDRIKKYRSKLSAVNSWATLYAIHSLNEEKFKALTEKYKLDIETTVPPFMTLSNVTSILKEKSEPNFYKVYAKLEIDEEALKGRLIDGEMIAGIEKLLEQIEISFPYLKMVRTGIDEKIESKFMNKLQQNKKILERQQFYNAVKNKIENKKKYSNESKEKFEMRCLGISREEITQMFINDPKSAFDYMGFEYDEAELYNKAMELTQDWADNIGQRVHERCPDPFKNANSTLMAA